MAFATKQKWRMTVIHPLANNSPEAAGTTYGFVTPAPLGAAVGGCNSRDLDPKTGPGFITPYSSGFMNLERGNGDLTSPALAGFSMEPQDVTPTEYLLPFAYMSFWLSNVESWDQDYGPSEEVRASDFQKKYIDLTTSGHFNFPSAKQTPLDGKTFQLAGDSFKALHGLLWGKLRTAIKDSGSTVETTKSFFSGQRWWSCGSKAMLKGPGSVSATTDVIVRDAGTYLNLVDETVYQSELKAEVERVKTFQSSLAKWAAAKGAGAKPTISIDNSKWLESDYTVILNQVEAIRKAYSDVAASLASPEGQAAEQAAYDKYVAAGGVDSLEAWRADQIAKAAAAADAKLGGSGSNSGFLDVLKSTGSWMVDTFSKFTSALGDTGSAILGTGIAAKLTGVSGYLPWILLGLGVYAILK